MLRSVPTGLAILATPASSQRVRRELTLLEGLRAVPPRVARSHQVIPLRYEGGRLVVGARDPKRPQTLDTLRRLGNAQVVLEPVSAERYQEVLTKWYGPTGDVAEFVAGLPLSSPAEPSLKPGEAIEATPSPRFLELTLRAAVAEGASDVHIEPDSLSPRVRFRVDGILAERVSPPGWLVGRV